MSTPWNRILVYSICLTRLHILFLFCPLKTLFLSYTCQICALHWPCPIRRCYRFVALATHRLQSPTSRAAAIVYREGFGSHLAIYWYIREEKTYLNGEKGKRERYRQGYSHLIKNHHLHQLLGARCAPLGTQSLIEPSASTFSGQARS